MKLFRSQEYYNKLVCTSIYKHLFSERSEQIISYYTTPNINLSEFKSQMYKLIKTLMNRLVGLM